MAWCHASVRPCDGKHFIFWLMDFGQQLRTLHYGKLQSIEHNGNVHNNYTNNFLRYIGKIRFVAWKNNDSNCNGHWLSMCIVPISNTKIQISNLVDIRVLTIEFDQEFEKILKNSQLNKIKNKLMANLVLICRKMNICILQK